MEAYTALRSLANRWRGRLPVLPRMALRLARSGIPRRSLLFGAQSLGDDLLCTAVLREARLRGRPYAMFTQRPELFRGNPDPVAVCPVDPHYLGILRRLKRTVVTPAYARTDPANADRDILPSDHLIAEMCRVAGLSGTVSIRPYLHLDSRERATAPALPRQIALHSTGLAANVPLPVKEWGVERFARLALALKDDFTLVQLGSASDPALPGVTLDLRGRTSLREAAAVLSRSLLFVGLEGFLVHLARAVDCPSVVIHGGRALPSTVDYVANINLHAPPACAPCGLVRNCPHDLLCLSAIAPETVAKAVRELAGRPREGLAVERVML